jgi:hypothetical protein
VQRALLDMSTTAQINDSLKLGGACSARSATSRKLHKGQVEQAGFAVLKAPDIPSVLVETAFISNPEKKPTCAARSCADARHLPAEPAAGRRALMRGISALLRVRPHNAAAGAHDPSPSKGGHNY